MKGSVCAEAATTLAPDEAQASVGARSGPTSLLHLWKSSSRPRLLPSMRLRRGAFVSTPLTALPLCAKAAATSPRLSSAGVNARVITGDEEVCVEHDGRQTRTWHQLGATTLGARQASTRHRHRSETELYVVVEGTGRMRISDEPAITLPPHSAVLVEPATVRQVFNDTDRDALWLVVGAPPEALDTLAMTEADLAFMYPDGPKALPPELSPGPGGD